MQGTQTARIGICLLALLLVAAGLWWVLAGRERAPHFDGRAAADCIRTLRQSEGPVRLARVSVQDQKLVLPPEDMRFTTIRAASLRIPLGQGASQMMLNSTHRTGRRGRINLTHAVGEQRTTVGFNEEGDEDVAKRDGHIRLWVFGRPAYALPNEVTGLAISTTPSPSEPLVSIEYPDWQFSVWPQPQAEDALLVDEANSLRELVTTSLTAAGMPKHEAELKAQRAIKNWSELKSEERFLRLLALDFDALAAARDADAIADRCAGLWLRRTAIYAPMSAIRLRGKSQTIYAWSLGPDDGTVDLRSFTPQGDYIWEGRAQSKEKAPRLQRVLPYLSWMCEQSLNRDRIPDTRPD